MAEKHILSLEIPTVANCDIMTVRDTSQYSDKLAIDCPELLVTPPGFNVPALINVVPNSTMNLTACDLDIQGENCGTLTLPLPDGVYIIRYSVAPNDKVYVEYNHLRVTSLMNMYYQALCNIDLTACEPMSDRRDVIAEMKYIRTLIDGAVANVEYCQSPGKGMDIYNFAKKRLQKLNCKIVGC